MTALHSKNRIVVKYATLDSARAALDDMLVYNAHRCLLVNNASQTDYDAMYAKMYNFGTMNTMVAMSLTTSTHFCLILDRSTIFDIPEYMCLSEVIDSNSARPFIDFDMDVSAHIDTISALIKEYYEYLYKIAVHVIWVVSSNENSSNKKYHCIVSGIYLEGCWKQMCIDMCGYIELVVKDVKVDYAVFRTNAAMRIVGQCKLVNHVHCRQLLPVDRSDLDVYKYTVGKWLDDTTVHMHPTVLAKLSHMEYLSTNTTIARSPVLARSSMRSSSVSALSDVISNISIPEEFVITDSIVTNSTSTMIRLSRVKPSYCAMCIKIHKRENAHIIVFPDGNYIIRCFGGNRRIVHSS